MEIIVYYSLSMIGISYYMLNRMKEGLCEEDLDWFLFISVLVLYLIPGILEVVWRII